uniref:Uncharacterized protein n=1 Tax=Ditylenchus dipsaci TaxID=166011 RepID=A0A915CS85_9BILA
MNRRSAKKATKFKQLDVYENEDLSMLGAAQRWLIETSSVKKSRKKQDGGMLVQVQSTENYGCQMSSG